MIEVEDKLFVSPLAVVNSVAKLLGVNSDADHLQHETAESGAGSGAIERLAKAACISLERRNISFSELSATDCPAIVQRSGGDFLILNDIVLIGGLALCVAPSGKRVPISLNSLNNAEILNIWRARPLLGEEINSAQEGRAAKAPLWKAFLPRRSILLPVVLATITINVLALAVPLATMNIFDRVISNAAFNTLWALVIGVVLAAGLDLLLRNLRALVMDRASAASDITTSNTVFGKILGAKETARVSSVGVQSNSLREFEGVREYFNSIAMSTLGDLPFVALFIFVIWLVAGPLALVPLIAIPIMFIAALIIQSRLRTLVEGGFQDTAHKNSVAVEIIGGIEAIKIANAERWAARQWEKATASQLHHSLAIRFWTASSIHLVGFFQGLTTIAVLSAGVYLVTAGNITPGALFAAHMLTGRCLGPIAAMAALLSRLHQVATAYRSIRELSSMEQERPENRQMLKPEPFSREIRFDNVSFAYDPLLAPVLRDVNLTIRRGEKVGIVGAIGSGKSSLLKLLMALQLPSSGQILFDGLPNVHIDPSSLRAPLGVVLQDPAFFGGTLRDNVKLGREEFSDADILKALGVSGALGWVRRQPLGLDTVIGEQGKGLSGGQKQTLALARALFGSPQLVALDEPTSDLDANTEGAIVTELKKLPQTTTLILVTHRPAVLESVDRIVVIEAGRIMLDGPKDVVFSKLQNLVEERRQTGGAR